MTTEPTSTFYEQVMKRIQHLEGKVESHDAMLGTLLGTEQGLRAFGFSTERIEQSRREIAAGQYLTLDELQDELNVLAWQENRVVKAAIRWSHTRAGDVDADHALDIEVHKLEQLRACESITKHPANPLLVLEDNDGQPTIS